MATSDYIPSWVQSAAEAGVLTHEDLQRSYEALTTAGSVPAQPPMFVMTPQQEAHFMEAQIRHEEERLRMLNQPMYTYHQGQFTAQLTDSSEWYTTDTSAPGLRSNTEPLMWFDEAEEVRPKPKKVRKKKVYHSFSEFLIKKHGGVKCPQ